MLFINFLFGVLVAFPAHGINLVEIFQDLAANSGRTSFYLSPPLEDPDQTKVERQLQRTLLEDTHHYQPFHDGVLDDLCSNGHTGAILLKGNALFFLSPSFTPEDLEIFLRELPRAYRLETLYVRDIKVPNEVIVAIATSLKTVKTFKHLYLAGALSQESGESLTSSLKKSYYLLTLRLLAPGFSEESPFYAELGTTLTLNRSLTSLSIISSPMGLGKMRPIAESLRTNQTLKYIFLLSHFIMAPENAETCKDLFQESLSSPEKLLCLQLGAQIYESPENDYDLVADVGHRAFCGIGSLKDFVSGLFFTSPSPQDPLPSPLEKAPDSSLCPLEEASHVPSPKKDAEVLS